MNVLRLGEVVNGTDIEDQNRTKECMPNRMTHATILFSLGGAGMLANFILMIAIVCYQPLRRWSHGLLFHQGIVDAARASLLLPLGISVLKCSSLPQCALIGTAFLLLVTVSTVNMLTSVLNDAPVTPGHTLKEQAPTSTATTPNAEPRTMSQGAIPVFLDSPQCVLFGMFMIWFASFTINLGPTFLSGALATWTEPMGTARCPLITESLQHYVLSVLWIVINGICIILTGFHLRKLHKDLTKSNLEAVRIASLVTTMISLQSENDTSEHQHIRNYIQQMEQEGLNRVRMFVIITIVYIIFWAPLSAVIIIKPMLDYPPMTYQVAIYIAFAHSFVNPFLLLTMHPGMREAIKAMVCCACFTSKNPSYWNSSSYSRALNRNFMETAI